MADALAALVREVKGNALVIPRDAVKVKEKLCDGVGGPVHRGKYKEKSVCVKVRHYRCHLHLILVPLMLDSGVQGLLWTWGAIGCARHSSSGGQRVLLVVAAVATTRCHCLPSSHMCCISTVMPQV